MNLSYPALMRKNLIDTPEQKEVIVKQQWLDLESLAHVEYSSEDAAHPIENAFTPGRDSFWQAATPGKQIIRLLFDKPQKIASISLLFQEEEQARTQEFVLSYSADGGISYQEILRQQYNFSPPDTCLQAEEYSVQLDAVNILELVIIPAISGGNARASLAQWLIA
jgi:hypothetical protein